MLFAEYVGTAMLTLSVLIVSNMFGLGTGPWYTAVSAGAALALIVTKFGALSGAHVNPAVTVGLWTLKKIQTTNALVYIAAQLLGGISALLFYNYVTNSSLAEAGSASFEWRVFVAEMVGAAVFGAGIISAISQKLGTFHTAFTIGISLTAGALIASIGSAGFINPAVALGNNAWDKTLVIAPIVGMVIGMNTYTYLFVSRQTSTSKKK